MVTIAVKSPGEKEDYRKLRDQLLQAETALKDQRESVAVLRRQLPMGPAVETDYVFREGPADIRDESPVHFKDVRLSELFAPGKDRLIVDHMMWGEQQVCLPDVYDVGRWIQCRRFSCQPESELCIGGQGRNRKTAGLGPGAGVGQDSVVVQRPV
jgi:predicted dithiol-disulfide oxidoreductase (DUF899 family)